MTNATDSPQTRRLVYSLLLAVVVGAAIGRVFAAELVYEPSLVNRKWPAERPQALPTFSSNDRARWATLRALVDHGTYAIGRREKSVQAPSAVAVLAAGGPVEAAVLSAAGYHARVAGTHTVWQDEGWDPGWDTVDKVLDPVTYEVHSSKPPLLSTLLAGLYWLLQQLTGWTLADNVWEVVRTILLLVNVLPFAVYLYVLSRLLERYGRGDWPRLFVYTAACFATLVTPFLVTLNNHTVATFSVLFALACVLRVLTGDEQGREQGPDAPPRLFAAAGLFAAFALCNEMPAASLVAGLGFFLLLVAPAKTLLLYFPAATVPVAAYFATNSLAVGQWLPVQSQFGSDWYVYEGSHWANTDPTRKGIDFAANFETRWQYALHVLVGHHGLFSLTPVWLLALAGTVLGVWRRDADDRPGLPWYFFPATLLLSAVVVAFYLYKSDNYGGWTAGLRWLMWLTPLWLLALLPTLERLDGSRWGRGLANVLLALSVLSASYPAWNPWRHPWLYRWMETWGWIPY